MSFKQFWCGFKQFWCGFKGHDWVYVKPSREQEKAIEQLPSHITRYVNFSENPDRVCANCHRVYLRLDILIKEKQRKLQEELQRNVKVNEALGVIARVRKAQKVQENPGALSLSQVDEAGALSTVDETGALSIPK